MHVGEQLREQRRERALVRGIGVGVQQRHRHRLRPRLREAQHELARERGVQRALHCVRPHALGHPEAQLRGHQRRGRGAAQVIQVRAVLASQLDHVGEAVGGEQRGPRRAALQQRVGGDRHAVGEALDVARRARPRARAAGGSQRAPPRDSSRRRRRDLGGVDGRAFVDQHGVGERAADVHSQEHPGRLREAQAAASSRFSVSARCWWEGQ